jgi:hypothetical protein
MRAEMGMERDMQRKPNKSGLARAAYVRTK